MKTAAFLQPSLILYNGNILTQDDERSQVEAIAIGGKYILATGTNEEILAMKTEGTRLIDAKGNTVLPGFNDPHCHPWQAGMLYEGVLILGLITLTT